MTQTPSSTVTDVYAQSNPEASESNSLLLIANRGTRNETPLTALNDYALYTRHTIPSQYISSPETLLAYYKDTIGATVQTGVEDSITLVQPDTVTQKLVSNQLFTDLAWNVKPVGWDNISGITIVGTAEQGDPPSGTIFKVSTSGYVITLSAVVGTFMTTAPINLNYVNKSVSLPDGDATEKFVLSAYYTASISSAIASTINVSVTQPTVDIILLSDRDGLFKANPSVLSLGTVDLVVDNGDGTLTLEWTTQPANWLYVPGNGLGVSYVEGVTAADTAIIERTLGAQYSLTNNPYNILVTPADGAVINTGDTISMYLDDTVTIFDQVSTESYKFVSVFADFTDTEQITSASGNLWLFTQYLQQRNGVTPVANGQMSTFGVLGATTLSIAQTEILAAANMYFYVTANYPYVQKFNDPTFGDGETGSAMAALLSSNEIPFNNQIDFVLNGVPVSSDPSSYITVSPTGDSEVLLGLGWLPVAVNNQKQPYVVLPITTQVFIPSTTTPDTTYNDVHSQQVIGEIKNRTYAISKLPLFIGADITDALLASVVNAVSGMQTQAELEGMLQNVTTYRNDITAVVNPSDSRKVDVTQTIQPTSTLSSFAFVNTILFGTDITQTQA